MENDVGPLRDSVRRAAGRGKIGRFDLDVI
jgi:hypothetical protein